MAQPPTWFTDDPYCPKCRPKRTQNFCDEHRWAYRWWWQRFTEGVAE